MPLMSACASSKRSVSTQMGSRARRSAYHCVSGGGRAVRGVGRSASGRGTERNVGRERGKLAHAPTPVALPPSPLDRLHHGSSSTSSRPGAAQLPGTCCLLTPCERAAHRSLPQNTEKPMEVRLSNMTAAKGPSAPRSGHVDADPRLNSCRGCGAHVLGPARDGQDDPDGSGASKSGRAGAGRVTDLQCTSRARSSSRTMAPRSSSTWP